MKAVGFKAPHPIDDPDSLIDFELETPTAGPRDLLVAVRAISVNPADTKIRASVDPAGETRIVGFDAAGVVLSVGAQVTRFKPGDEVYYAGAIDRPGSNAQFQVVDERIVGRKPTSLGFAAAAAMPLTSLTAWELLFDRFNAPYGKGNDPESLLVIGAAGGVGSMAVQIARQLTNLTVVATASRPDTIAWVRELGAHHVIDHRQSLTGQVKPIASSGIDYIFSLTSTDQHFAEIAEFVAPEGHVGLIDDPKNIPDVTKLKTKSAALHWEWMFARPRYQTKKMACQGNILDKIADFVDAGVLRTTMRENYGTINAVNLKRAHAKLESGTAIGKIVLEGFDT
jgi:zinc-binding alcohol dehydrogenase family protein